LEATLVDRVRQAIDNNGLRPVPPFAAAMRRAGDKRVGVLRVYESDDTPHIMRNGAVYVREVARDKEARRGPGNPRYEPVGAPNHRLNELADRGRLAARGEEGFTDKIINPPLRAAVRMLEGAGLYGDSARTATRGTSRCSWGSNMRAC
jgi:hypothetical protein